MSSKNRSVKQVIVLAGILIPALLLLLWGYLSCVIPQNSDAVKQIGETDQKESNPGKTAAPERTSEPIDASRLEIPVVGMKEKDINKTQHPKTFRKTTESYVKSDHIVYYSDANAVKGIPCTVSLTCRNGIVTEVNDYRDDPKQIIHFQSDSSGSKKQDNYYGDAEEFYYDHIEEFADFDEAEEYYNDHYR